MEDLRLDFHCERLIAELLYCESFVRDLFFGRDVSAVAREYRRVEKLVALRTVLCNYMYDTYLRLVISEKSEYVRRMSNVGTLLFLWSLKRAAEIDETLFSCTNNLQLFSKHLNNLRRTTSLDILLPEALCFVERSYKEHTEFIEGDHARPLFAAGGSGDEMLTALKTRYNPAFEALLFDHSCHHDEAFVPCHRFCDSRQSALNMSRYVGYTMRENISKLYKYVRDTVDARTGVEADGNVPRPVCPCVIIFNFFVRDSYRMYYSKSLRQTSFVTVVRGDNTRDSDLHVETKFSFMIMTNIFPKVGSWFKSINNQLVKKTGKVHIQHLDSFVRLLCQISYLGDGRADYATTKHSGKKSVPTNKSDNGRGKKALKKKRIATQATHSASVSRVTLSSIYRAQTSDGIFKEMFATRYRSCRHERIVRTYEQMRANDESATLVRVCVDCGACL